MNVCVTGMLQNYFKSNIATISFHLQKFLGTASFCNRNLNIFTVSEERITVFLKIDFKLPGVVSLSIHNQDYTQNIPG